ncbi:MAG: MerR family transcriptional regulator [Flavobacteriaceae bacterium]|jgi:DNA-binding transcriptional MerR regulator|nr:MerR family transcriptional regulator [Flavobacteriaceae bacterium]MCH1609149.1 MerR family transcriptional regulator [Flavobacteriaceae bacterium]MDG1969213.1 MerR family transcriptional regulator [Flavobacteriaceae bacterium]|tara:strand:+ start:426 stop:755 length:330 start_codon:yes stop_codon:yes gene_type:complete
MHVDLPEKRYYSIGEIAKAFDVNPSLLRFWEKEFKEINPKKKKGGSRKYTPEDVVTIQKIHHLLKEKGLTIEGAKKQLKLKDLAEDKNLVVIQKLEQLKSQLHQLKENL